MIKKAKKAVDDSNERREDEDWKKSEDEDSKETKIAKMLNLKLLWSYIDCLNVLKNEVVLTVVPIEHVGDVLSKDNGKDLLNIVS